MEAEEGIEPSNDGFANHCLTTWLLRRSRGAGASDYGEPGSVSTLGFARNPSNRAGPGFQRPKEAWMTTRPPEP